MDKEFINSLRKVRNNLDSLRAEKKNIQDIISEQLDMWDELLKKCDHRTPEGKWSVTHRNIGFCGICEQSVYLKGK
jgi:hypothetical protein